MMKINNDIPLGDKVESYLQKHHAISTILTIFVIFEAISVFIMWAVLTLK